MPVTQARIFLNASYWHCLLESCLFDWRGSIWKAWWLPDPHLPLVPEQTWQDPSMNCVQ